MPWTRPEMGVALCPSAAGEGRGVLARQGCRYRMTASSPGGSSVPWSRLEHHRRQAVTRPRIRRLHRRHDRRQRPVGSEGGAVGGQVAASACGEGGGWWVGASGRREVVQQTFWPPARVSGSWVRAQNRGRVMGQRPKLVGKWVRGHARSARKFCVGRGSEPKIGVWSWVRRRKIDRVRGSAEGALTLAGGQDLAPLD